MAHRKGAVAEAFLAPSVFAFLSSQAPDDETFFPEVSLETLQEIIMNFSDGRLVVLFVDSYATTNVQSPTALFCPPFCIIVFISVPSNHLRVARSLSRSVRWI